MSFADSYLGRLRQLVAGDAAVMDDESSAVGWFNMARSVEAYLRFKKTGEFQII